MNDQTIHDSQERHCPKLGHEIAFAYCRSPGNPEPCRNILDCWWERFDIRGFIADTNGQETLAALEKPPEPKIVSIFDLIRQAQQRQ